jgi:uncharacterized protein YegJ (DUF2314 family)
MGLLNSFIRRFRSVQEPSARQQTDFVSWASDDKAMQAAKALARSSLPEFFEACFAPNADQHSFLVKFTLDPEAEQPELIWACDLEFRGNVLWGRLANNPINTRYNALQLVQIDLGLIVDWRYNDGDTMCGNFTTSVLTKGRV